MATEWTAYAGIEVLDVDHQVKCRHPLHGYKPDKLAILGGASLLALADDVLLVVCDECGYNGITGHEPYVTPEGATEGTYKPIIKQADSVLAHINGKHLRGVKAARRLARDLVKDQPVSPAMVPVPESEKTSRYSDAEIAVCIKIWLKWKGTGVSHWPQHACDELTARGFTTQFGGTWNSDQLGSLVHNHIKKEKFRNLKAAALTEEEQNLADVVRASQAREARSNGGNHLADNVRITTKTPKGAPRQTFAEHRPVDFAAITDAAKLARQEVETPVTTNAKPTLSFSGTSDNVEPIPTKTLMVEPALVEKAPRPAPAPSVTTVVTPAPALPPVAVPSDFVLVQELDDGTLIFTYQGKLMGGKPVTGFQI